MRYFVCEVALRQDRKKVLDGPDVISSNHMANAVGTDTHVSHLCSTRKRALHLEWTSIPGLGRAPFSSLFI